MKNELVHMKAYARAVIRTAQLGPMLEFVAMVRGRAATGFLLACVACGDPKQEPPLATPPALLGQQSPAMIDRFAASCPTRIYWSGTRVACPLTADHRQQYLLDFDDDGMVTFVHLSNFLDDDELLATFDRAISPIVAPAMRDTLRRSITTPSGEATPRGERTAHLAGSQYLLASWTPYTLPSGIVAKNVAWSYHPPKKPTDPR